ncbi:DNA polymerase Y family protein [Halorubrum sp. DTA98]|uniref:DNA polymerase Y family protein n=1 Tax=Halorubrum sp. DTA98 TaxID=3402163 RepID=UPI003AACBE1E
MGGRTLPGAGATDEGPDRVVFHVDMDCFYASCERLREPDLRGEPLVVGMGYEPGETIGAVATASYEARAFGVESAMPISEALELLPRRADAATGSSDIDASDSDGPHPEASDPAGPDPDESGHYRTVDLDFYKQVAADVKAVLHDCADVVREVSIDEAYLDVTDRTAWSVASDDGGPAPSAAAGPADARTLAEGYARHVKARIEREAGVPASVGVAPNMSTAKVASDADKPNGLVVVPPGSIDRFLAPLPTAELHGVGPVTERTLSELGIETAGDLAEADPDRLVAELGERGRELFDRARGADDREVTPTGLPKSLSRESSLSATAEAERKRETVAALAADIARRARERGCLYRTIGIKVVEPPYDVNTRARSLPGPVDDPDLVEEIALDLLTEFEGTRARKLGVRVSKLDFGESDQATLEGFDGPADGTTDASGHHDSDAGDHHGSGRGDHYDPNDGPSARRGTLSEWTGKGFEAEETGEETDEERSQGARDGQASLGDWA